MSAFVVDTNVMIVAHGKDTHADRTCQSTCTEMLEEICRQYTVAIDDRYRILGEYEKAVRQLQGAPSISHTFFKHMHINYGGKRVRQVEITPCNDGLRSFEELPENKLDPSDRKFLAVAVVAEAEIVNATDSDWSEQEELTRNLGVNVRQLCPQHAAKSVNQ